MGNLELYFSDLNPEAQQRLLDYYNLSSPQEGNWDLDISPLLILEEQENVE